VLFKEIKAQGYAGKESNLRHYLRSLKPLVDTNPVVRFETPPGKQMQVDWADFRQGNERLSAFIATLGFSRMAYVEFVTNEKVDTLLGCLQHAFEFFNGVTQDILFDNMKTVVLARHAYGEGQHRFHPKLWDFAKHYGFMPKLCLPYRAQTKGKVERFIGYLRRSFYVPLKALLAQAHLALDVDTANREVKRWLHEDANQRFHATTQKRPIDEWHFEKPALLPLACAYPLVKQTSSLTPRASIKPRSLPELTPPPTKTLQHDLAIYQQLLY
jgi:transposase